MKNLNYKGYVASIEFDQEDQIYVGHIVGINDIVGFHGKSMQELEIAFKESVDNYLAACYKLGQKPEKTYSGNINLQVPIEIHAAVAVAAQANGISINQWATQILEGAVHQYFED